MLGILGLGIISCSVYVALGYWWIGSASLSQAAEPVTMLNLENVHTPENQDLNSRFNNIHHIQQNPATGGPGSIPLMRPSAEKLDHMLLAQTLPMSSPPISAQFNPDPSKGTGSVGRPDPFSPLVIDSKTQGNGSISDNVKKDVLADVLYTGFIGDSNSRDKVALIGVFDSLSGIAKTQIKKTGESLNINGQNVVVKSISKNSLKLNAAGELRELMIQPYQTGSPQPLGGTTNSNDPKNQSSGNTAYSMMNDSMVNSNPTQPVLRDLKEY